MAPNGAYAIGLIRQENLIEAIPLWNRNDLMLFNSIQFLVFFAVFLPVYFFVPSDRRWLPILVASYVFYMAWNVSLSVLLMGLTVTAFGSAIAIERSAAPRLRQAILTAGICAELAPLLIFKYTNFVISTTNDLGAFLGWTNSLPYVSLILPVGISFHTFQMIGYLVDVHSGRVPAERHFGRFAGFVVFFPQLVAGPIERSYHMLPQFWRPTRLEYVRVRDGLLQAGWGLSKKVCVADLVAPFVAGVYANPRNYNGSYLLIATVLFSIQIYCDFSGYTDMALGIAKILGYDLMANFRQPYFSTSLAEFWRRWHISLSTWFRDYVYIPLGGNRVSGFRWVFNIMIVFILSGVWHGPAWTFVIWGALHGLCLVIETKLRADLAQRDGREDAEGGTHRPALPRGPAAPGLGGDELRRARELGLLPGGERRRRVLHPHPPPRFRPRRVRDLQDLEPRELRAVIGRLPDSRSVCRRCRPAVPPRTRDASLGNLASPVVLRAGVDLQRGLLRGVRAARIHLLCLLIALSESLCILIANNIARRPLPVEPVSQEGTSTQGCVFVSRRLRARASVARSRAVRGPDWPGTT